MVHARPQLSRDPLGGEDLNTDSRLADQLLMARPIRTPGRLAGFLGADREGAARRLAILCLVVSILGGLLLLVPPLLIAGSVLPPDVFFVATLLAFFVVVGGVLFGLSSLAMSRVARRRVFLSVATSLVLCSIAIFLGAIALARFVP